MKAFLRLIIRRRLTPALLVMFLISATVQAAEISPLEGLELARKGFAGMTDFTAEITQEKQIALLKKTMTSSGQVRFRRPDTFFMEVYSPYASRLLLSDNILTMLLPAEGIRQKTVLPPEEGLRHWFSLFDRPLTRLPAGVELRADRRGDTVTLRIIPAGKKGEVPVSGTGPWSQVPPRLPGPGLSGGRSRHIPDLPLSGFARPSR